MRQQAGNSMNVLSMALIDLHSLTYTHIDTPVLFKQICDGRRTQQQRRGRQMQDVYTRHGSGASLDVHVSDSEVLETDKSRGSELPSRLGSSRLMSDKDDVSRKPTVPQSLSSNSESRGAPEKPKESSSCGSTHLEMLAAARKAKNVQKDQKSRPCQKRLRRKTKCTSH